MNKKVIAGIIMVSSITLIQSAFAYSTKGCSKEVNKYGNTIYTCQDGSKQIYNIPGNKYYDQFGGFVFIPGKNLYTNEANKKTQTTGDNFNDLDVLNSLFSGIDETGNQEMQKTENETKSNQSNNTGVEITTNDLGISDEDLNSLFGGITDTGDNQDIPSQSDNDTQINTSNSNQNIKCKEGTILLGNECKAGLTRNIDGTRKWNIFVGNQISADYVLYTNISKTASKQFYNINLDTIDNVKCELLLKDKKTNKYMIGRDTKEIEGTHKFKFESNANPKDLQVQYRCELDGNIVTGSKDGLTISKICK